MAKRKSETQNEPQEAASMGVIRCPDCGLLHIGILDEDDNPMFEMSLDDAEALSIALKLLTVIFPTITAKAMVERIRADSAGPVIH